MGRTLALAYAQTHPERVTELVLRGIFLLRAREIEWFYQDAGGGALFPDAWERYVAPIPESERGDLMRAYHRRLTSDDRRRAAARPRKRGAMWEGATSFLRAEPGLHREVRATTSSPPRSRASSATTS